MDRFHLPPSSRRGVCEHHKSEGSLLLPIGGIHIIRTPRNRGIWKSMYKTRSPATHPHHITHTTHTTHFATPREGLVRRSSHRKIIAQPSPLEVVVAGISSGCRRPASFLNQPSSKAASCHPVNAPARRPLQANNASCILPGRPDICGWQPRTRLR